MDYLYIEPTLQSCGIIEDDRPAEFSERHHFRLPVVTLKATPRLEGEIDAHAGFGVIVGLSGGLPNRRQLRIVRRAINRGRRAFLYWPAENAIEVVDRQRLGSLWRHWLAYNLGIRLLPILAREKEPQQPTPPPSSESATESAASLRRPALNFVIADFECTKAHMLGGIAEIRRLGDAIGRIDGQLCKVELETCDVPDSVRADLRRAAEEIAAVRRSMESLQSHMDGGGIALNRIGENLDNWMRLWQPASGVRLIATDESASPADAYRRELAAFREVLRPVPFPRLTQTPSPEAPIPGTGVYVRTDYWARLVSGGSYGHTCYVAKELSAVTQRFRCLMASRFALLDELGIVQEVIRQPLKDSSETDLLRADRFHYQALRDRLQALQPTYLYERLCLGNFAVARLSRELNIPYIVEYNGSEISMRRSFGSGAYAYEDLFQQAEEVAFRQATIITVISDRVRDDVIARCANPAKVFVNPNGVDCEEYVPPSADERREIRASLDFADEPVVGFIGTFGGWHGIDVLAAALPKICRSAPEVKFLLIGDGNLKSTVRDAIRENKLDDRVVDVGRTEQQVGARLLKAADIFVSPHSSHMVDSPFFGSPTKLFEYMALGGGIVASDLEQLGVVITPALRPSDFASGSVKVRDQRGVLCRPGDVDDFVAGVLALVRNPDVTAALGRNARAAALAHYSWRQHVRRIWDHVLAVDQPSD